MDDARDQTFQGQLNGLNLSLGASLLGLAAVCAAIGFGTGMWEPVLVAGIVVGLPVGLGVGAAALQGRRRRVTLSAAGIGLDDLQLSWSEIAPVVEVQVVRHVPLVLATVDRHLRHLDLAGKLTISDQWLRAADYDAIRQRIAEHTTIEARAQAEGT